MSKEPAYTVYYYVSKSGKRHISDFLRKVGKTYKKDEARCRAWISRLERDGYIPYPNGEDIKSVPGMRELRVDGRNRTFRFYYAPLSATKFIILHAIVKDQPSAPADIEKAHRRWGKWRQSLSIESHRQSTQERIHEDPEFEQELREADAEIELAQQMVALRTSLGLSQHAAADAIGVKAPHLSRLESGGALPTITTLWKLADAYNASFRFGPRYSVEAVPVYSTGFRPISTLREPAPLVLKPQELPEWQHKEWQDLARTAGSSIPGNAA